MSSELKCSTLLNIKEQILMSISTLAEKDGLTLKVDETNHPLFKSKNSVSACLSEEGYHAVAHVDFRVSDALGSDGKIICYANGRKYRSKTPELAAKKLFEDARSQLGARKAMEKDAERREEIEKVLSSQMRAYLDFTGNEIFAGEYPKTNWSTDEDGFDWSVKFSAKKTEHAYVEVPDAVEVCLYVRTVVSPDEFPKVLSKLAKTKILKKVPKKVPSK